MNDQTDPHVADRPEDAGDGARQESASTPQEQPPSPESTEDPRGSSESTSAQDQSAGDSSAPNDRRDHTGKDGQDNSPKKPASVVVRYGLMQYTGEFRHNLNPPPRAGQKVVVRTDRGVELGEVVVPVLPPEQAEKKTWAICGKHLQAFLDESGPDYPFRRNGRVLRMANQQDLIDFRHLRDSAQDARRYCRGQIRELNLPMRLVTVEHLLGGERIVFYFTSETRVDFRELVRRLASEFRTRIEMRQVGARDEARLVGDYERCGQRCCCQEYLKDLKPVSMRMAKVQKATLDPSKISGRCGRLMCCLRYEDECYKDLKKQLPRKNIWVRTTEYIGRVVDCQIITQLVRLQLKDNSYVAVPNESILERNIDPEDPTQGEKVVESRAEAKRQAVLARERQDEETLAGYRRDSDDSSSNKKNESSKPRGEDSSDKNHKSSDNSSGKRRRRRRRSKRKSGSGSNADQNNRNQSSSNQSSEKTSGKSGGSSKKRRRRRPRKRKPKGGGNSGDRDGASS